MPTLLELQQRLKRQDKPFARLGNEETLIVDVRGKMRPGEFVDQKLRAVEDSDSLVPVDARMAAQN